MEVVGVEEEVAAEKDWKILEWTKGFLPRWAVQQQPGWVLGLMLGWVAQGRAGQVVGCQGWMGGLLRAVAGLQCLT